MIFFKIITYTMFFFIFLTGFLFFFSLFLKTLKFFISSWSCFFRSGSAPVAAEKGSVKLEKE